MGGFRKAMPFTFATFTIGALALAGFPLTSGFFSKDEILAFTINRGGFFVVLGVLGYLAAGLTAFYAFRHRVPRVLWGRRCRRRASSRSGRLAHHEPENPLTRRARGHGRGLPGPGAPHRRARVADARGDGAAGPARDPAGVLAIPGVTDAIENFLEPTLRGLALRRHRAQRRRRVDRAA